MISVVDAALAALYLSSVASTHRAEARRAYVPHCPHYPDGCRAGCAWIDVPYPEQLARKRTIVADALCEYVSLRMIEVPSVAASPMRLGYRARVKLVARKASGEMRAGLYRPGSHEVLDISSCPVHPETVNRVVQYLKREVDRRGIAPYDEKTDAGELRYIDIRFSFFSREMVLTLVTRRANFPRGQDLARALMRRFNFIAGVAQNVNEDPGNVIWGPRTRALAGRDTVIERIGDWKLRFPVGVFSQANPLTARKLYDQVRELAALNGDEIVLDIYCGVGPIALNLAASAQLVWAADDSALAIATAKQNARMNGVANCRFFAADAAEKIAEAKRTLPRVDLVVVNPPRKGLQPEATAALLDLHTPRVIYVSCNPETLARDLDKFHASGYRVAALQPFDMFPQTDQVETVCLLIR
jgi:23S rRNA (uracil1939-C5)-methyltransferase